MYVVAMYGTPDAVAGASTPLRGPMMCSTWMPASRSQPAAPNTAAFSDLAPCDPPVTSSTGRSVRRPKCALALSPSPSRSRSAISRRIGMPMYLPFRSWVSG